MTNLSTTQRLKRIQARLGLEPDGLLGPVTLTALEAILPPLPDQQVHPDYSLIISQKGLDQLVRHEISSESYYRRYLSVPVFPGGGSGVTIGIGYDLGYNSKSQIRRDWLGKIPDIALDRLAKVAGLKGEDARREVSQLSGISIPLDAARTVFYASVLTRYAAKTRSVYGGVEMIPADAQAGILSLVYNRGASMSGPRRREMKAIAGLVIKMDQNGIAGEIRAMKRLWEAKGLDGLLLRREEEATLVENAQREYDESELIYI